MNSYKRLNIMGVQPPYYVGENPDGNILKDLDKGME